MKAPLTIFVRLVRADRAPTGAPWPGRSHVKIIETLTQQTGGYSVGIPLWADYREGGRCYDVQVGVENDPAPEVERLWERIHEDVQSIWVRAFDATRDVDHIFAVGAAGATEKRRCRYAFDEVRIRFREGFSPPRISLVSPAENGEWLLSATGAYLCGNDRSLHGAKMMLTSLTTLVSRGTAVDRLRPAALAEWLTANGEQAENLDFFWKERLVHRRLKPADSWRDFSLDDWDNCVDEAFLVAMQRLHRAAEGT